MLAFPLPLLALDLLLLLRFRHMMQRGDSSRRLNAGVTHCKGPSPAAEFYLRKLLEADRMIE